MLRRIFSVVMFILLLTSMLTLAFNIQPVKATGTIYIRADGSIDPPTAPISTVDNITYTFTDDIFDSIVVQRDDIVVDGAGYTVQGTGNGIGLLLDIRSNVTIRNMEITTFEYGIRLHHCSNNSIFENNIRKNRMGINIYAVNIFDVSNYNSISGNNITENDFGINAACSNYNSISGNNVTDNGMGIYFYTSSNSNSISENYITGNGNGISLYQSSNYTIVKNDITNNLRGIDLTGADDEYSSNTSVSENNIEENNMAGIYLWRVSNTIIAKNNITGNGNLGGICVSGSPYNTIFENKIANNNYGITVSDRYNWIYHNNLLNNTNQAHAGGGYVAVWDDDYPSGGNYWSDYSGADVKKGPDQNETGSDGIGDTPYTIEENNRDYYPLMNTYGGPPTPTYALTITATANGTTDPGPGTYMYSQGQSVPVQAVPDTGYGLDHWELDGADVGSDNPYSVLMDDNHTLNTVFVPAYTLTITTIVGGTTDPSSGSYVHNVGTDVSVTAIPDAYYSFDHWELDGLSVGSTNPYTVLMDSDHALHAVFVQINYTLTITTIAGGTTNPVPGAYTCAGGSNVQITAIPAINYTLDHWELDGVNVGSANPISVLMDGDHTLHAVFSLINYTLTISASTGGTTDPAPGTYLYSSTSSVSVTAIPDADNKFVKWLLDGTDVGSANPYSVIMDSNHTLHAVFELLTYRLTILSSTGGTTDPTPGSYTYVNGTYASASAIPNEYYLLDYWLLDGNNVGSSNPISVLMTDNNTLQAVFVLRNYTLVITATTGGTTNPVPGTYVYTAGASVLVTHLPEANYIFDHWELDGVARADPISVTMDKDHTLHAVFVHVGLHDIAITNVASSKTVVGQSYSLSINVTVANQGDYIETFNATGYANTTIISSQNVTLPAGNSTTVTFTWNTAGFVYGNYTLSAYAWPVPGENDTSNNQLVGGQILVSIPGDINGDGVVDIYDAILLANAYGSTPGKGNWNPNADINGDNIVDIYDAIFLANHYNQHYQ